MTFIIPEKKFREIANGLLERTKSAQVNWEPDEKFEDSYVVRLPKSTIAISQQSAGTGALKFVGTPSNHFVLGLRDANDLQISEWEVAAEAEIDYRLLGELYREASRVATKWDEVLEDIERALQSKQRIGQVAVR